MRSSVWMLVSAVLLSGTGALAAPPLTFEQRLAAQEAIERIYHAHRQGETRPFPLAVPRTALESKVDSYLRQSVALDSIWSTPITGEMLAAEFPELSDHIHYVADNWFQRVCWRAIKYLPDRIHLVTFGALAWFVTTCADCP